MTRCEGYVGQRSRMTFRSFGKCKHDVSVHGLEALESRCSGDISALARIRDYQGPTL